MVESSYLRVLGMRGGESYLSFFYVLEVYVLESYWNESLWELFWSLFGSWRFMFLRVVGMT